MATITIRSNWRYNRERQITITIPLPTPSTSFAPVMTGGRSPRNRSFLLRVVAQLYLGHVLGRLLGPGGVAVPMRDHCLGGKTSAQERPAVVPFNADSNWHALHDLGEFAGDDVP